MQKAANRANATRGSDGGCEYPPHLLSSISCAQSHASISRYGESDDPCKMTYSRMAFSSAAAIPAATSKGRTVNAAIMESCRFAVKKDLHSVAPSLSAMANAARGRIYQG